MQENRIRAAWPTLLGLGSYAIVLLIVTALARHVFTTENMRWLSLVVLLAPIALIVRLMIRNFRAMDELDLRIHLESIAITALVCYLLLIPIVVLRAKGLLSFDFADLGMATGVPLIVGIVARSIVARRYTGS